MSSIAQKPKDGQSQTDQRKRSVDSVGSRCRTVALIGPDGSGKSTIAQQLIESCPLPLKYLYMGTSIESANYALPTSRLVHQWKVYRYKKALLRAGQGIPDNVKLHGPEHRYDKRGTIGGIGRLLRRVSEESYRQLISWIFQLRGKVVLYDRHFLFDACPAPNDSGKHRFTDRLHYWFLRFLYPRPDLAIMLDAPSDVMYSRKQEVPPELLEQERNSLLQKRSYAKKFVQVDTTKPLKDVVQDINEILITHCSKS